MTNKIKSKKQFYNTEIPEDWEIELLEDVCSIFVGRDLKEENFSAVKTGEFQIPVYSNTVENEGLYGYYNFEEFSGESLTIVGRGAGLGTAFTRDSNFGAIGRLLVLFPKNDVSAHYVTEFVNGILRIHQESGGIPQLTGEQISKYKISIPSYQEQKAIASVLSTWDVAIQKTEQLITQKELRKKWLMQQLLTGKKRLKGFDEEWKEVSLGNVCDFVNGMAFKPEEWKNVGIPIIRIQNLNGSKEFNYCDKDVIKKHLVEHGDLLFAWSGSRGTSFGAYRWFGGDAVLNQHIFNVYSKNGLHRDFAFQILRWLTIEIERKAHGSAGLVHVTKKQLENELMKFPKSKEEQTAIAQVLQAADKEITLLRAKADKLREQKKGLMQMLLTGKKRLKI